MVKSTKTPIVIKGQDNLGFFFEGMNMKVKSKWEIVEGVITNPNETLEGLFGEKYEIEKVVVR